MKDLLRIADLNATDLQSLLDQAQAAAADPHHDQHLLVGDTVALYFAKPSTRTCVAFQTAVMRLGGMPLTIGPGELQHTQGEILAETARDLSRYVRAIVVRAFADADLRQVATAASVPIINALSDRHDPCQTLAGLLTLRQRWGALAGRKVAYVGDGGNVAHSLLEAAALAGMDISVATPYGLEPHPEVVARARALAAQRGCRVQLGLDPAAAVRDADAVVTDAWLSMHDPERARAVRAQLLERFRVDEALLAAAKPDVWFLHCLPAFRGQEVTSEVIDGPRSLVLEQAANLLPVAQALLSCLLRGRLRGHPDGPPVPDDSGPLVAVLTEVARDRATC
ncbi:MAG TPA: ornithine carbamoyltransferase [Actinomycetes bacterium]|nr:ornithine carbamoyltransferase [Actinomycetes bacterium]